MSDEAPNGADDSSGREASSAVSEPLPASSVAPVSPAPSKIEPTGDALFEALWSRVVAAWDDDKPHVALLDYCIREQRLPDAAGRYRAIKDAEPERAARAQRKLDGIVVAATHMLFAMKTPEPVRKVPLSITLFAALLLIAVVSWLTFVTMRRPR